MLRYSWPFFFLLGVLLISCSADSSSEEIHSQIIINTLEEIKHSFNYFDIDGVMSDFDEDFYHNGLTKGEIELVWQERMSVYDVLKLEEYEVYLDLPFALARFKMTFENEYETEITFEPSEKKGDISYFFYSDGKWSIIGDLSD